MNIKNIVNYFNVIKYSINMVYKYSKLYLLLYIMKIIINSISPLILIIFPKYIMNSIIIDKDMCISLSYVVLMVILSFISAIFISIINKKIEIFDINFNNDLKLKISKKINEVKYEKLEDAVFLDNYQFSLESINRASITNIIANIANIISKIITCISIISIISRFSLILIPTTIIIIVVNSITTIKTSKTEFHIDEKETPIYRKMSYASKNLISYENAKEARIYNLSNFINNKYYEQAKEIYKNTYYRMKKYIPIFLIPSIFSAIQTFLIYLYIVMLLIKDTINIGDFTLLSNSALQFGSNVNNLVSSVLNIEKERLYIQRYNEFLQIEQNEETFVNFNLVNDFIIEFINVYYKYPNTDKYAISGLSLTIKKGEHISIVGENGAGKTTFIKLLLGLYKPTYGKILLNGIDITQIKYSEYIKFFSVVYQDYFLTNYTIGENISMNYNTDENKAYQSLNKMNLEKKIKKLKLNLNTYLTKELDNNGTDLSVGEKQKLAIVRSLYKDAPIFIVDEPTASLSPQSESDIYNNLSNIFENKTIIFISHRLASCRICDKILYFHNSKLVEEGSHEELMIEEKLYWKMFTLQQEYYRKDSDVHD